MKNPKMASATKPTPTVLVGKVIPAQATGGTAAAEPKPAPGRLASGWARLGSGAGRSRRVVVAWVSVAHLDDDALTVDEAARAEKRRRDAVRRTHRELLAAVAADARDGLTGQGPRTALARAEHDAAKALAAEDAPAVNVARTRAVRRLTRGLIVAGVGWAVVMGTAVAPGLLLVLVPVVLGGLWWIGGTRGEKLAGAIGVRVDAAAAEGADPAASTDTTGDAAADVVLGEATPVPPDRAAWVLDALAACGIPGGRVLTVSHRPWGVLINLELPKGGGMLAERLADVEAAMRLRVGGLSYQVDPRDAGVISLRARRTDPWAGLGSPQHHKPLSLSVRRPLPIGLDMDGASTSIGLCRTHMVLVGGSGSGKSSALWTVIDVLSACEDVVLVGIDLTGAPALMAWGDVIQRLATTEKDAKKLLTRLVGQARGRSTDLGERSVPRLGQPLPDIASENWEPRPDGPQIVLIIDEYPALVEAGLWPLVSMLLKIARKGAITVILATQRATKNEMGSTTVAAQIGLRALLACDVQDVQLLLGPGMRARGWTPDRLQPAQGDDPADAGVVYLYGGQHVAPVPKKFARLSLSEVHRRAIERMEAGLPRVDATTKAYGDAAELEAMAKDEAKRARLAGGEDGDFGDDFEDEDEPLAGLTPDQVRLLQDVLAAMGEATRGHLGPLAETLSETDAYAISGAELGAELRAADVNVRSSVRVPGVAKVTTGVYRADLEWRLREDAASGS